MAVYPGQTADLFKRSMGSRKEFKLGNKTFTATELSAMVLRSLKEECGSLSWRRSNGSGYQCSSIL